MKRFFKVFLILGLVLTVLGGAIFTVAMSVNGWDFSTFSSHEIVKKTDEITDFDEITSIKVSASVADVKLLYHSEQKITVEGFDVKSKRNGKIKRSTNASVDGNVLSVSQTADLKQIFETGTLGNEEIIIRLPIGKTVSFSVSLSTGDVTIGEQGKSCQISSITVSVSTGDVKINASVESDAVQVTSSTGDFTLNGSLSCKTLKIETDTGKTYINGMLTADRVEREADTGDMLINASIIAGEISLESSTGQVKCSAYITANKIDIETSTGDVTLKLLGAKDDYSYIYELSTGDSNISSYISGERMIKVEASTGDVKIYFER
ncbi:MAG: hypothetical protein IKA61_00770 [Clostridia bacterium]|nr:hypothetical protein [Clostridia bacterium]